MPQSYPTRTDSIEAIIAQRQAIRARIDAEDDEDRVAKLTQAEDRLVLRLAQRRELSDDEFFDKVSYLLTSQTIEFGEPTMQDPFGPIVIALRGAESGPDPRLRRLPATK